MTTPYSSKEDRGGFQIYKTAGQVGVGPALNTQTNIPVIDAPHDNPMNNSYPGMANGAVGSMNVVKGGKTPIIMVTTAAFNGWFTYQNLNDWIGGSDSYCDANFDTSTYSANITEPIMGNKIYNGAHCQSIVISYNAQGGGIMVQMMWPAIYGPGELESQSGTSPTFAAWTRQYGQLYGRGDVKVTGFDQDKSFVLALVHAQARQFQAPTASLNTVLNAVAMTAHGVGGSLAIEQQKTATTVPTSTATIQIGPATTGVKFICYINQDRHRESFPGNAPGSQFNEYSLADVAGANSTTPGYPFQIVAGT